jgi:1,4-dihydroxy-2-naphthoate octaprenyltransferase
MNAIRQFIALGRPLHLLGGALFVILGALIAATEGANIRNDLLIGALLGVAAVQLMTHYSNDYFDYDADSANQMRTRWSGGSGVLPQGALTPQVALWAALTWLGVAVALALLLIPRSPAPGTTLTLFGAAVVLSWGYSAPPFWLNRRSLGELTGGLVVPGLPLVLGYQVQAGALTPAPLLAAVPLVLMQFAMLIAVNVPDAAGDASVGKRTLVVRYGAEQAAWLYCGALALAYLLLPPLVAGGLPPLVAGMLLFGGPLALWLGRQALRGDWLTQAGAERMGFWSIGLLIGSGLLQVVGFTVSSGELTLQQIEHLAPALFGGAFVHNCS